MPALACPRAADGGGGVINAASIAGNDLWIFTSPPYGSYYSPAPPALRRCTKRSHGILTRRLLLANSILTPLSHHITEIRGSPPGQGRRIRSFTCTTWVNRCGTRWTPLMPSFGKHRP